MSRFRWNCPKQQKSLLFIMLVFGIACGLVAQGYRPGQTFSQGQQAAPTPAPQRPVYRQPVYRQATPVPVPPQQQRRAPAAPASMYNMQQRSASQEATRPRESDNASDRQSSSEAEDRASKDSVEKEAASSQSHSESKAESADSSLKADDDEKTTAKSDSDSEAEATPRPPESTDKLVFFSRRTGKKQIALTYDDGPNPTLTPKLIDWLKANNVPATFFMEGDMVKAHKDLAKEVADAGFELANHTYNHPNLRNLSEEKIIDQLQDTHDLIKEATGIDVKMMRPPYGAHNSKVDAVCKKLGYKIVNWDIDTNDWQGRSADQIVDTIMSGASDGSIILMHDRKHKGRESSLEATQRVVPALRAKGYTFVTVGELIGLDHPATEQAQAAVTGAASAPAAAATTAPLTPAALATPQLPTPAAATPTVILPQ